MNDKDTNDIEDQAELLARLKSAGLDSRVVAGSTPEEKLREAERMLVSDEESGMSETRAGRVRENRLRRLAQRQGLMLQKSRRRDPSALDYGRWFIVDQDTNGLVAGDQLGITLDDVEAYLTED